MRIQSDLVDRLFNSGEITSIAIPRRSAKFAILRMRSTFRGPGVGSGPGPHDQSGLETRNWILKKPLARLQRSFADVCVGTWFANSSSCERKLSGMVFDVQMEEDLRHRIFVWRTALHPSILASWLELRGIQDDFMREKDIDYFENSRRATFIQQRYAIRNPRRFAHYSEHCWGITASDGPGPASARVAGVKRKFLDYAARGVPFGPDDGTIAP